MKDSPREQTLKKVALAISKITLPHPVRVGIDGMSASGKTFLADELANILREEGKRVIRVGLDGFHNPPETRHAKGPMSVVGYLEDSFNFEVVEKKVLRPLGPGGNRKYLQEIFDHQKGEVKKADWMEAPFDSILIFEGVMLFRKGLSELFDFKIFVDCSEETILKRAKMRDLAHFENLETLLYKYHKRFLPGQRRHLMENKPMEIADLVFGNDVLKLPSIKTGMERET